MVSITHVDPAGLTEENILIPYGGCRMEMDWDCIARAFEEAAKAVCWDVDIRLTPETQHAMVLVSPEDAEYVGDTSLEFDRALSERIGMERYMSIWIDYGSRELYRV
jgi:hypothetical protein